MMPHDARLWTKVLRIMKDWEDANPDAGEKPDEYRARSGAACCSLVSVVRTSVQRHLDFVTLVSFAIQV